MKFFTRKASRALRTRKGEKAWDRLWELYKQHLKRIRPHLSKGWRKIAETSFHDAEVFAFGALHEAEFIINIDMYPRWKQAPLCICSLHFRGVRTVHVPLKVQGDVLIYDEVHVTPAGAREWRALLVHSELRIVADDVDFVINHEPWPKFRER